MDQTHQPHVLLFPIPFQGPVNCFLKLAELLCLSGINVTFLNTEHIHRPLLRHTNVLSRFNRYPNFTFQTIPDGVEHDKPVSVDQFLDVMASVDVVSKPLFREMMVSGSLSRKSDRPVTLMIPDAYFSFAVDIAIEASVPVFCFETVSPCCMWTSYLNLPQLIEAGVVPFKATQRPVAGTPTRGPSPLTFLSCGGSDGSRWWSHSDEIVDSRGIDVDLSSSSSLSVEEIGGNDDCPARWFKRIYVFPGCIRQRRAWRDS